MVVSCPPIEKMSCPIHPYFGFLQASLLETTWISYLYYIQHTSNIQQTLNEQSVNNLQISPIHRAISFIIISSWFWKSSLIFILNIQSGVWSLPTGYLYIVEIYRILHCCILYAVCGVSVHNGMMYFWRHTCLQRRKYIENWIYSNYRLTQEGFTQSQYALHDLPGSCAA